MGQMRTRWLAGHLGHKSTSERTFLFEVEIVILPTYGMCIPYVSLCFRSYFS